jgi:hypothetical protein
MILLKLKKNIKSTIIKFKPVQSTEINDDKLTFNLLPDIKLEVNDYEYIENNHIKITLTSPISDRLEWFAFSPHIDIIEDKKTLNEINLNVPYYSQRDNRTRPHQTCNMTCAAMIVQYFYPDTKSSYSQLEDEMTAYCTGQWGFDGIYYPNLISATLNHWGVSGNFGDYTWQEAKAHLAEGNPCIYNGKFTGSGHFVVFRGFNERGFLVNDPWGEWFASGYQNKSGANLLYSYNLIQNISFSGSSKGRFHLCKKMEKN